MTWAKWVLVVYALINIAMGIHGFVGAGSLPSLAGGVGAGFLLLVAVYISLKVNPRAGYIMGMLIALLMLGRFLPAFLRDNTKVYPHLVSAILAIVVIACLLGGHLMAMKARKAEEAVG